jgi:hypothetical protein
MGAQKAISQQLEYPILDFRFLALDVNAIFTGRAVAN